MTLIKTLVAAWCCATCAFALAQTPAAPAAAQSPQVVGAGATFPAKVYQQWAQAYGPTSEPAVAYQPSGSSAGVRQVVAKEVDFGASDVPLAAAELDQRGLFQFPTMVGGIVPVVNLPGVPPGALRLDAPTLAAVFAGQVERWNDPAIRALNPGQPLPNLPIVRVVRADGSGTTEVFVRFLREAAPEQAAPIEPQGGKALWPGQVLAVEGSGKLSATVKATPGAIGYVSSDYVVRDGLAGVRLRDRRGAWVSPTVDSYKRAIVAVGLFRHNLEPVSLLNVDGVGVWPIVTATYVLVPKEPVSVQRAARTLHFFYQSFLMGDKAVAGSGFAPLPIATQARIVALLSDFRTLSGQRVPVLAVRAGQH